jgi:hypothetical protein
MCYGLERHEVLVQRRTEKRYFEGGSVDGRKGNVKFILEERSWQCLFIWLRIRTSSGLLRLSSELPRFTREGDLLTKWKTIYPLKKNHCCVELFSLYFNSYIWLVVGLLRFVFSALISCVLNVACNWVVNSCDNNEHHFIFSTFIYRLAYVQDSNEKKN